MIKVAFTCTDCAHWKVCKNVENMVTMVEELTEKLNECSFSDDLDMTLSVDCENFDHNGLQRSYISSLHL